MERPGRAFILAGAGAALLTVFVLGVFSTTQGWPWWMPLNATSHAVHGQEAIETQSFDWQYTGLGTVIHVLSCFFWAFIGLILLILLRRGEKFSALGPGGKSRIAVPWIAGLAAAGLAGVVDYGLIPARLTPGWELVLGWQGVIAGLCALALGLALGLSAGRRKPSKPPVQPAAPPQRPERRVQPDDVSDPAFRELRHRKDGVLDQRMQRIDPAGKRTADPDGSAHRDLPKPPK